MAYCSHFCSSRWNIQLLSYCYVVKHVACSRSCYDCYLSPTRKMHTLCWHFFREFLQSKTILGLYTSIYKSRLHFHADLNDTTKETELIYYGYASWRRMHSTYVRTHWLLNFPQLLCLLYLIISGNRIWIVTWHLWTLLTQRSPCE